MKRLLAIGLALGFATAVVAAEIGEVRTRARIERTLATTEAATHAEAVVRHGRAHDTSALVATLERIEADDRLDPTARTVLIQRTIVALAAAPPDPAAVPMLQRHLTDPQVVRTWHEDEGHRVAVEAYDTGSAASYTLRAWRRTERRDATLAALARGEWRADEAGAGTDLAFTVAPLSQLAMTRNELMVGLGSGAELDRPAIVAARRLGDRDLARQVVERGRSEVVVHSLDELADAFPAQDAFNLLARASERADLGTAAVAGIGRFSATMPAAREWLLARLDDARLGAAAAHALAQDAGAIPALESRLDGPDALARNRAALALYLNGSQAARDALARAHDESRIPDDLRRSIATWLR